ncbi:MAG: hypothetical protein JNM22_05695 [Saprospiraceae bacterium]|nr:hypothetical protein [Saprospiraceae bacterium]
MKEESALTIAPAELVFEETKLTCPIEDGHRMVPVKTVCTILDIDFQTQDSWLKDHRFFSQLYRPAYTVGADNKQREMNCLSIFDLYAWVSSVTLNNRKPGSIDRQYRLLVWLREKMLDVYKSVDVWIQENKYEQQLLTLKEQTEEQLLVAMQTVKELKARAKEIDTTIEDIRMNRFTGQTALPFPENEVDK